MTSELACGPSLEVGDRLALITLRKPATINAIDPEDIVSITALLESAVADPAVATILIRGEGARGFCAGGDIKRVRSMIVSDQLEQLAEFWSAEYRLDHLIATCPKPIVSIANGLTLGGGMGLASHASHRVVSDSTRMGMPEVLIGLSPDVGGLWLFSRAPGRTGVFAALTGAQLSAGDALHMGLADHYVPGDRIEELTERLRRVDATEVLGGFTGQPPSWVADHSDAIDRLFGGDTVGEILDSLSSDRADPAVADVATSAMTSASPTALSVTHEALRRAAKMSDLAECLEQDLWVGQHCARHPDLIEGIRARVLDKDRRPRWCPPTLADVSAADITRYFEPIGTPLRFGGW